MSPPLRVLLVDPSLFSAPYDRALGAGLAHEGLEVELLGRPLRPGERSFEDEPFRFAPRCYPLAEGAAARLPAGLRLPLKAVEHLVALTQLERRVRRRPVDVVHWLWLPWPLVDGWAIRRLRRLVAVVLTVHDRQPFQGAAVSPLQRRGRGAWKAADALVVHTAEAAAHLRAAGAEAHQILVVPHPPLALPADLQPSQFVPPVRTLVLFGELKPYKGLEVLLEALARTTTTQLRLIVAGRPRMEVAALVDRARAIGLGDRIEWRLHRLDEPELAEVLGRADAFVLPYLHADASGVLALVLALGRPVVASRVGAMAEVLEDGVSALLVPPGDVAALAHALDRLGDDRTASQLAHGTALALRQIGTWDAVAARHVGLYRKAIAQRLSRTIAP